MTSAIEIARGMVPTYTVRRPPRPMLQSILFLIALLCFAFIPVNGVLKESRRAQTRQSQKLTAPAPETSASEPAQQNRYDLNWRRSY